MKKNINRIHLKNDIILVSSLLLVSLLAMMYLFVFKEGGNKVKVTVDGELYGIYPLSENLAKDIITGDDSANLNRLIINDGKAYVESASCPDGICASHRPIFRNGESIICLPNRVVITVITDENVQMPDVVA